MAPPAFKRRVGPVTAVRFDGTETADLLTVLAGHEYEWRGNTFVFAPEPGRWQPVQPGEWVVRSQPGEVWKTTDQVFGGMYEPV